MKRTILILLITTFWLNGFSQFVARMEVKEDIPGLCDKNNVYVLLPSFKGQVEAVCPVKEDSILKRLNTEVPFVKENPTYTDKGMIGIIINCKGVVVKCKMDNKTKDPELDQQIETVFNLLGTWKAGKLNKKEVDTSKLYSFKIINGVFTFN